MCHGMTEVVPDKDGSDPYEVRHQLLLAVLLCQHWIDAAWLCVPELGTCIAEDAPKQVQLR